MVVNNFLNTLDLEVVDDMAGTSLLRNQDDSADQR